MNTVKKNSYRFEDIFDFNKDLNIARPKFKVESLGRIYKVGSTITDKDFCLGWILGKSLGHNIVASVDKKRGLLVIEGARSMKPHQGESKQMKPSRCGMCGETLAPDHACGNYSSLPTPPKNKSWAERFDKLFGVGEPMDENNLDHWIGHWTDYKAKGIKSFISQELQAQEQRVIEEADKLLQQYFNGDIGQIEFIRQWNAFTTNREGEDKDGR